MSCLASKNQWLHLGSWHCGWVQGGPLPVISYKWSYGTPINKWLYKRVTCVITLLIPYRAPCHPIYNWLGGLSLQKGTFSRLPFLRISKEMSKWPSPPDPRDTWQMLVMSWKRVRSMVVWVERIIIDDREIDLKKSHGVLVLIWVHHGNKHWPQKVL